MKSKSKKVRKSRGHYDTSVSKSKKSGKVPQKKKELEHELGTAEVERDRLKERAREKSKTVNSLRGKLRRLRAK